MIDPRSSAPPASLDCAHDTVIDERFHPLRSISSHKPPPISFDKFALLNYKFRRSRPRRAPYSLSQVHSAQLMQAWLFALNQRNPARLTFSKIKDLDAHLARNNPVNHV